MERKNGRYLLDILLLLLMGALLYYGVFWKNLDVQSGAENDSDVAKYACYAVAFWHGQAATEALPAAQCSFLAHPTAPSLSQGQIVQSMKQHGLPDQLVQFVANQSATQPLHALPHEYPLLTLLPFSLGLVVPYDWYLVAFALWMIIFIVAVYFVLKRFTSHGAAYAFALYMVVGCWATGAGRFDILPSALTLLAVLCAKRTRWRWAFALLAIATLLKFYPVVLLVPFFIAQQAQFKERWYAWSRFVALGVFVAICAVVTGISLLLSVEGTFAPLGYFGTRPIQLESSLASLVEVLSALFGKAITYQFSFGSRNILSPLSSDVTLLGTVVLIGGLLYTFWLQWRAKIGLALACLLTLLIVMLTGKVFSAQYLIWVAPLVAYVGRANWRWLVSWGSVCLLTTVIYPFLYEPNKFPFGALLPPFSATVLVRNVLLLLFTCALLFAASCNRRQESARKLPEDDTAQLVSPERDKQKLH
jgi:Glycosyltransferase family 87